MRSRDKWMKGTEKVRSNSQLGIKDSGCGREKACKVVVTPCINSTNNKEIH